MPQLKIKVDTSRLRRKLAAMKAARTPSRRDVMQVIATHVGERLFLESHQDTNRYVRGWMQAATEAGATVLPMPPLRRSRHRDRLAKMLGEQLDHNRYYLQKLVLQKKEWYDNQPDRHRGVAYMRLVARIEKQRDRVARARKTLLDFWANDFAIVMMKGTGASLNGYEVGYSGTAINASVRIPIYGGAGKTVHSDGASLMILHNKEPHSQVLEKRFKTLATATNDLRAFGLKTGRATYLRGILAGAKGSAGKVSI